MFSTLTPPPVVPAEQDKSGSRETAWRLVWICCAVLAAAAVWADKPAGPVLENAFGLMWATTAFHLGGAYLGKLYRIVLEQRGGGG